MSFFYRNPKNLKNVATRKKLLKKHSYCIGPEFKETEHSALNPSEERKEYTLKLGFRELTALTVLGLIGIDTANKPALTFLQCEEAQGILISLAETIAKTDPEFRDVLGSIYIMQNKNLRDLA